MKPSDVFLEAAPPLTGTMHKAEAEAMAAIVVLALAKNGDQWRAIGWPEVRDSFLQEVEKGGQPWAMLARNPFWRPNLAQLLKERQDAVGFRYRFATEDGEGLLTFTFAGLLALSKWRKASAA